MNVPPTEADRYAVDRFREECHLDDEGYLHTGSAAAGVDRVIIRSADTAGTR